MTNKEIIDQVAKEVRQKMQGEGSDHDWWHVYRVWQNAKHITTNEQNINNLVVELAALLHDITDWKSNAGDSTVGAKVAGDILKKYPVKQEDIIHVEDILTNLSFKGVSDKQSKIDTMEGMIVQDADRLEALGAIGIARTFAYGGAKGTSMYDPEVKADINEFGKRISQTSINHFYEKLLLIKDLMNTKTGKKIAEERHKYVEDFLKEFLAEWEGKK